MPTPGNISTKPMKPLIGIALDWFLNLYRSSIQVFDAQGGRHTVEARYFRVGTRTEAGTGAQVNSWDVIISRLIKQKEPWSTIW